MVEFMFIVYFMFFRLNHPVKRFKPDSKEYQRNVRLSKNEDLYSMFNHNGITNVSSDFVNNVNTKNQQNFVKQEIQSEIGCTVSVLSVFIYILNFVLCSVENETSKVNYLDLRFLF